LAANIDMAAAVVSLLEPRFKPGTVSQFLAGAQSGGARPLIILNKVDLGERRQAVAALAPFEAAGVRCIQTSVVTGEGVEELKGLLGGNWTLFYGQSGVGKSSLLNAMCPEVAVRTAAISSATHWGRHTTTGSRLYPLSGGGYVIDSPGMRAFTFWQEPERGGLDSLFPEIAALAAACNFADCSHTHEPGCAVKAALDGGEIDQVRYKHYVRLARSDGRRAGH
jgi:ribosome biogenesis GTPase